MEPILLLFVHIVILVLVFSLLYWIVTLLPIPAPMGPIVRNILLILLALGAILFLLGEIGLWGNWGYHGHR